MSTAFLVRRRKESSAWITSTLWSHRNLNFWTSKSCFFVKPVFDCEHPFFVKRVVMTEPAVPSVRILGLSLKLYPSNKQRMLNNILLYSWGRVRTLLSSSDSRTFHDFFHDLSFSCHLFLKLLCFRVFLTLNSSTDTNSGVHLNVCRLRCSVTSLYLTLSLICHRQ